MAFVPRRESAALLAAVSEALELARPGARSVFSKAGGEVVTDVDLAVEDLLRARAGELGLAVVGEERGGVAPSAGAYLLVDPVCGTRNFASAIPLFAVNVALVEDGVVVAAVVGDGASGARFVAERGRGAFDCTTGAPRRVAASAESGVIEVSGWPASGTGQVRAARLVAALLAENAGELRSFGTTLSLVYLAAGRIAAQLLIDTPALHAAAGVLLAEEAGALVSDLDGAPWSISSTSVLAAASRELHGALLASAR